MVTLLATIPGGEADNSVEGLGDLGESSYSNPNLKSLKTRIDSLKDELPRGEYSEEKYHELVELQEEYIDKLEEESNIDSLTGLEKRFSFYEDLGYTCDVLFRNFITRAKEGGAEHYMEHEIPSRYGIISADLNNFKSYNDKNQAFGDNVLSSVGQILKEHAMRGTDKAVRVGGDEFLVFLSDIDSGSDRPKGDPIREVRESLENELKNLDTSRLAKETRGVSDVSDLESLSASYGSCKFSLPTYMGLMLGYTIQKEILRDVESEEHPSTDRFNPQAFDWENQEFDTGFEEYERAFDDIVEGSLNSIYYDKDDTRMVDSAFQDIIALLDREYKRDKGSITREEEIRDKREVAESMRVKLNLAEKWIKEKFEDIDFQGVI